MDDALRHLSSINPRAVQMVEMRFFGGLSVPEIAAILEVSDSTVEREWRYARAWLRRKLGGAGTSINMGIDDGPQP